MPATAKSFRLPDDYPTRLGPLPVTAEQATRYRSRTVAHSQTPVVPPFAATFDALAERWRRETGSESSARRMAMHECYQAIIGMGEKVLPLIMRELQTKRDHWFWALRAITTQFNVEDPAKNATTHAEAIECWTDWWNREGRHYVSGQG